MTIKFIDNELVIGSATIPENVTFRFSDILKLGGGGSQPSWQDIVLSGNGSLTLTNAKANGINYVKLFGGCEQRNLPDGYTQYEYLRSSGTQYIDLGYKGNGNIKVEVKFKYYQASSATGSGRVFGSRSSSTSNAFAIGSSSGTVSATNNKIFWCYDGQSFFVSDNSFNLDEWQTVVFSATEHKINGTTEGDDYNITTFETPNNLKLFAFDNNGTNGIGYVDIAYCKLWNNGILVRDVIPAYDGTTYSMYDRVSGAMLPNAGTGDFTVGSVVSSPTPDTPMDIISSNGVLTFGVETTYTTADGQGTFVTPSSTVTTRIYKAFGQLKAGKYKVKITGDFEFIFQYKDDLSIAPTNYGNIGTWATEGEYEITDSSLYYGVAIRNGSGSGSIYPSNFNNIGSIGYKYLGIMPVGTTETVEVTGKNLNGGGELENKGYTSTGGTSTSTTFCGTLWKIKVKEGEKYTVSYGNFPNGISGVFVNTWKTDGTWNLRQAISISSAYTYTIPAGIGEVNFTLYKTGGITIADNSWLQVEKGDTATTYEPYYNGGSATAENLLAVGSYKDEQNITTGEVTRNIGIKVFDGTETFINGSNGWISEDAITDQLNASFTPYCTHFKGTNDTPLARSNTVRVYYTSTNIPRTYFGLDKTIFTSTTVFKQYLTDQYNAGTPVIVVYPLATATTETVTGQPLTIQAGTNIVEITQASIDNLGLEVSYKAGVTVTVTEVQNAQLDNSVTVTIGE